MGLGTDTINAMTKLLDINYTGEWLQNIVVGLLTGLISGIFVSMLFVLPNNPSVVGPYLIGFGVIIAVFVIGNVFFQSYREKINRSKCENMSEITPILSSDNSPTLSQRNVSESDIDDFCKSVIAWKVSATKKDEIFQLFKDNPYYLMGYLAYLTKRDIEETKDLQRRTFAFMFITVIVGYGALIIAVYALAKEFIVPGLLVVTVILLMVIYISLTWKSFLKKSH